MTSLRNMRAGKIRRRFVFYGDVQGVGFRWQAKQAALAAGITGWVRNEYNGSVTMEAQGREEQVDAVLHALEQDRWIRITRMETADLPLMEEEHSFRVRF